MDDQTRQCRDCYAAIPVSDFNRHRRWHEDLDRKLRYLQDQLRRLSG